MRNLLSIIIILTIALTGCSTVSNQAETKQSPDYFPMKNVIYKQIVEPLSDQFMFKSPNETTHIGKSLNGTSIIVLKGKKESIEYVSLRIYYYTGDHFAYDAMSKLFVLLHSIDPAVWYGEDIYKQLMSAIIGVFRTHKPVMTSFADKKLSIYYNEDPVFLTFNISGSGQNVKINKANNFKKDVFNFVINFAHLCRNCVTQPPPGDVKIINRR